ncbi:T9SS type A sorting domain-containing protein, partial [Flammeovirga sp. EKP202]|uniref:T9SS type A sorting domain-containing protein n=1 Tax=Flammeovirga sp. EKP202 TaxID=2770592 RepID=UPI00165EF086
LNNENNRNLSVSEDGTYHCIITNPDYPSQNNITTGKYTMIDVSEFQADSLAILSLKSANPDVNLNWSTSLKVVNWDSVTHTGFQGDPVSAVKLKNIGLSTIPSDFMNDGALLNLDTFDISNNKLTFYDLYNAQAIINQEGAFIDYSEQAVVGEEQSIGFKEEMITLTLDPTLVDTRNQYQWYKDNIIIDGATDPTYTTNELGGYYCLVTNNDFSSLTLQSASTFIYSVDDFISDSTIVASIYTNNPNNTLNWDILSPINTWEGVKLRGERGRVKALILNAKQLDLLPENLGELTELELLEVGNNRINELPNSIGMLKVLKEFKINSNQLNDLVNELYDLEQLEVIDISNNQISSIDPKISQLSQLQQAHIQDNYFTFDDIQQIPLERNRFTYSPQQIIGEEQQIASAGAITIQIDPSIDPDVNTNQYTWLYNGVLIPGEKERTLVVDRNYGEYQCIINNTEYTDLTLTVASIFVETDEIDENDKLILEAIKALNTENTLDWPDDEPVAFWEGVRVDGITAKVIELDLWNKNLDVLPDNFAALNALKNVNLSSNNLSELPENIGDLAITLAYFNASQNHFSFAELDKIRLSDTNDKINFVYTNQKLIGVEGEIVTLENGYNTIYIPSFIQTENDVYQWYYQGKPLADATNNSVIVNTTGDYNYTITNSNYDNIVLTSFPIKVDGVTNIEGPINNKISIYPNPTENIATVQTTENIKILDVQIYDVTGKKYKIETNVRSITQWTLDLTKVPNGMYLINVQTDQGITLLKITKQ